MGGAGWGRGLGLRDGGGFALDVRAAAADGWMAQKELQLAKAAPRSGRGEGVFFPKRAGHLERWRCFRVDGSCVALDRLLDADHRLIQAMRDGWDG